MPSLQALKLEKDMGGGGAFAYERE